MTDRILDFSQAPARLSMRNGLLTIERAGSETVAAPVGDLAAVILAHPQVLVTQAVLGELAAAGLPVIVCDTKHRPSGMLLPLEGHGEQTRRFREQASMTEPRKKRLWRQIVVAKIRAQGRVLEELLGGDYGLSGFAKRVKTGDAGNVEAHAARRYWALLFPEGGFRRGDEEDARNHLLNYGYAVVRSAVTRGLCASGLHPALGLHHGHRYNTFPLADDLMEPFRPAVDRVVALAERADGGEGLAVTPARKRELLGALTARYRAGGESRTLLDWITRTCQSAARAVSGKGEKLEIPEWTPDGDGAEA
jgi:CRISPR-associated protein Cas1